jgi:hypothetical protein
MPFEHTVGGRIVVLNSIFEGESLGQPEATTVNLQDPWRVDSDRTFLTGTLWVYEGGCLPKAEPPLGEGAGDRR